MTLKIELPISDELIEEAKRDPDLRLYLVKRLALFAERELDAILTK